jgi:hypothetical protein
MFGVMYRMRERCHIGEIVCMGEFFREVGYPDLRSTIVSWQLDNNTGT